jgi:ABC-type transporter Mla subunit MlaD
MPATAKKSQLAKQLGALLDQHGPTFISTLADVLADKCSDLDVENHDEIDDAVFALRQSLVPYEG